MSHALEPNIPSASMPRRLAPTGLTPESRTKTIRYARSGLVQCQMRFSDAPRQGVPALGHGHQVYVCGPVCVRHAQAGVMGQTRYDYSAQSWHGLVLLA